MFILLKVLKNALYKKKLTLADGRDTISNQSCCSQGWLETTVPVIASDVNSQLMRYAFDAVKPLMLREFTFRLKCSVCCRIGRAATANTTAQLLSELGCMCNVNYANSLITTFHQRTRRITLINWVVVCLNVLLVYTVC